ncbi:Crp/Fnr family transcriptional regulator [Actinospica sp. MGRD01-02]|uniref:Crp/Fnr family transcriptional regulator n=1 Tax=Actinospica acidithermotolerans TaxID=2828514 RepID=A0A941EF57_9ACTN|nr:Crp/Fnr family transcriptional regulator [Actinospica acidithermotolerans]MBR7827934.1 Crp/Fnr family transcriptional regulator [Actinospica acidithermotolerans]
MGSAFDQDVRALIDSCQADWLPSSFLGRLPRPALDAFQAAGTLVRFRPKEILITEDDAETDVFLLLSSCVKVTAALDADGHALLAIRVGGDIVGEIAATDGGRRVATVRACGREPVYAIRLAQADFHREASAYPDVLLRLSGAIGRKLRTATRRRVDYSGQPPLIRLARVLVELADDYGQPLGGKSIMIGVDLTKLELGTLVGVTQTTAERALRTMREQGLIDTRGRRPIVRDAEAMRALARPLSQTDK